jgi:MtN3 and saliva related transmembrane protein
MISVLGLLAGTLTTACWLPQVARSIRTRSMRDFSWAYLGLLACGILLWVVYGLGRRDPVILCTNLLTLYLLVVLMCMKAGERIKARAYPVREPDDAGASRS